MGLKKHNLPIKGLGAGPVIPNRLASLNAKMKGSAASTSGMTIAHNVSQALGIRGTLGGLINPAAPSARASASSALAGYFGYGAKVDEKHLYAANDSIF